MRAGPFIHDKLFSQLDVPAKAPGSDSKGLPSMGRAARSPRSPQQEAQERSKQDECDPWDCHVGLPRNGQGWCQGGLGRQSVLAVPRSVWDTGIPMKRLCPVLFATDLIIPLYCSGYTGQRWTKFLWAPGASKGCPMDYPTLPIGFHWAPLGWSRCQIWFPHTYPVDPRCNH